MQQCVLVTDVIETLAVYLPLHSLFQLRRVSRLWSSAIQSLGEGLLYPFVLIRRQQPVVGGLFHFVTGQVDVRATSSESLSMKVPTGKAAPSKSDSKSDIERYLIEVLPKFYTEVKIENNTTLRTPFVLITDCESVHRLV